jgi:hypothetical protein
MADDKEEKRNWRITVGTREDLVNGLVKLFSNPEVSAAIGKVLDRDALHHKRIQMARERVN